LVRFVFISIEEKRYGISGSNSRVLKILGADW